MRFMRVALLVLAFLCLLTEGSFDNLTNFFRAIILGDIETVRTLIESDRGLVNLTFAGGIVPTITKAPLAYASQEGHVDIVELLITYGAEINYLDQEGYTALMYASRSGHVDVVNALISHGADINRASLSDSKTALIYASEAGHIAVVETLLAHGARVQHVDERHNSALVYAIQKGEIAIADLLITAGADIDATDWYSQETLLIYASREGKVAVVKLLLSNGANVDATDYSGRSALIWSADKGHVEIVKMLIAYGAKVNHVDLSHGTALYHVVTKGRRFDVSRALILAGADTTTVIETTQIHQMYLEPILRPLDLIKFSDRFTSLDHRGIPSTQGLIAFAFMAAKKSGEDVFADPTVLQFLQEQKWTSSKVVMVKSIVHQLALLKCTDLNVLYLVAPFVKSADDDMIRHFEIGLRFLTDSIRELKGSTGSINRERLLNYTGPILNAMIHRASPLGLRPVVKALYTIYWKTFEAQLSLLKGLKAPPVLHAVIHSFDKGSLGVYADLESRAMAQLAVQIKKH